MSFSLGLLARNARTANQMIKSLALLGTLSTLARREAMVQPMWALWKMGPEFKAVSLVRALLVLTELSRRAL